MAATDGPRLLPVVVRALDEAEVAVEDIAAVARRSTRSSWH